MAIFQPQIVGKGGETYIAGKGINIDEESKEISVVDPVLVNESTIEGVVQIGDYELLDSNGTIPEDRLANTTSAIQGQILTLDINKNAIWADPDALPASTKYGANLVLSIDSSTYVVTAQLKDQDGNNLGNSQTIDLPLESVVVSGRYDDSTKKVILTLQSGSTVEFSIADLIDGLQNQMQFSTMPEVTSVEDGTIVQYTGTTNANYTNGYFYKRTGTAGDIAWTQVDVMPAGSSLPDQTGNAGKYLTTDGTNASWSNKPLVNKATGANSLAIGENSSSTNSRSVAIGTNASTTTVRNGVAIGPNASVSAAGAIQLGSTQSSVTTNSDTNTFKVANSNGNFEMMSADGTIPEDRLANTASATAGQVLTLDANKNAVWANSGGGGGGDYVPQYSELPEASYEYIEQIVQYIGDDEILDPTIKLSQGDAWGISNLEVDRETFLEQVENKPGNYYFWNVWEQSEGRFETHWFKGLLKDKDRSCPVVLSDYGISYDGDLIGDDELKVTVIQSLQNGCFYKCVDEGEHIDEATIEHTAGETVLSELSVDTEIFGNKVDHKPGEYNFYTNGWRWFTDPEKTQDVGDSYELEEKYGIRCESETWEFSEDDIITVTYQYNEGGIKWKQHNTQPDKEYTSGKGIVVDNKNNIIGASDILLMNEATGENSIAVGINSVASGKCGTAFGNNSHAGGDNVTAVGYGAYSNYVDAVAIGKSADVSARYSVGIGTNVRLYRQNCIFITAAGSPSTSFVNSMQNQTFYVKLDPNSTEAIILVNSQGLIPAERLASTTGLANGNYRPRLTVNNGTATITWVPES